MTAPRPAVVVAETIAAFAGQGRGPVVPELLADQASDYVVGWAAGWADVDEGDWAVAPVHDEFIGPLAWIAGYYEALRGAHATGRLEVPTRDGGSA